MKIFIVRGAFLNPFELQNYSPLKEKFTLTAISSKKPISGNIDLPLVKLPSPADLPNFPFKYPILNRIFTDAHQLFGLERVVKGADVVHVAETYFGYTHQAVMAKRRGLVKKVISTVWEIIPHNNEGIRGRKEYKRLAYESVDHFIAVTELAKKCLVKEGVSERKITVINVGLDLNTFKPKKVTKNKRDLTILCAARLVPEKGVEDLLKAFLGLRKEYPNLRLRFVGDGPLRPELEGYKNVSIKKVSYKSMPHEYAQADIFCLPSRQTKTWEEQYGMVLMEALASGMPIVTTNTGAIKEVCGPCVLYSRQSDPDDLKKQLARLVYNSKLREKLGEDSRRRAEEYFDRMEIAKKIEALYRKILCQ